MSRRRFAVILAGGSGQRFWPLSRRNAPKQLLRLFSGETLLEQTLARVHLLVDPADILVLTNREQEDAVRAVVGKALPPENIVAEPARRDTAPAIALGAAWVAHRDRNALMAVLPADHRIADAAGFARDLDAAFRGAERTGSLVTIGVPPTWACPSFGYIQAGAPVRVDGVEAQVRAVVRFREKPNRELAEVFLRQGGFSWNAGMFIWSIPRVVSEMAANCPALAQFVKGYEAGEHEGDRWHARFLALPGLSIDYAVMEGARDVVVLQAGFDWDDVGSWPAMARHLTAHGNGNAANCPITLRHAAGNIVYSRDGLHVALHGVNDLIVVQTGDVILVSSREGAERIKEIVGDLPPELQ